MPTNYKDTLLIQQTDFEMKASLNKREPEIQSKWESEDIYNEKLKLNKDKKTFVLHDGPPYANGDIHVGHSLNKILKDFIVRWKNSIGYNSPYIMGWDTHGLPIETAITKTGINRKEIKPIEFIKLCREYALKQVSNQSNQFKRLGIFTDYEKKYVTLDDDFVQSQLNLYLRMVEKKIVYRDMKPIYWSPSSESALAEAEIEYKDVRSPSVYVALKILDGKSELKDSHLVIWTTTPWTLPSNQLVAVNEEMKYGLYESKTLNKKIIVALDTFKSFSESVELTDLVLVKEYLGKELLKLNYEHPWFEYKNGFVVSGHHVTSEAGTGLVHIAGGFGEDDFLIVKKNNLVPFMPIDDQGKFIGAIIKDKELENLFYEDANKIIGMKLEANKKLIKLKFVKHSYPHDWRTKQPIIFRATPQWFVSLDSVKKDIDNQIVKNVETKPAWSKERLRNIIKDRNDWTISRQRLWGVPIIAFYDMEKNHHIEKEVVEHAIKVIKEKGVDSWFELPADDFLPTQFKNKNWTKEKDILDVWFDSGSSNIALSEKFGLDRPFDVYLEGNDQYRGWFNSSMINSVIYDGKPAYKTLITHGMTNDSKGMKMSKSIGNTINPLQIADELGSDILRLWVSSTDYTDDQKIGNDILKQVSESYRKIRNTLRFILANLSDFDPAKNYKKDLSDVDKYALHKLTTTKNKIIESYNSFQFNNVYKLINNYIINDLSSFYLDFIKDILYIEGKDSTRRRQVQTVMYENLFMLVDVLRPIIPHTIEDVYKNIKNIKLEKSVHLLDIKEHNFSQPKAFEEKWNVILKFRDEVNEAMEIARNQKIIKKNFEAVATVQLNKEFDFIKNEKDLNQIFIINSFIFKDKVDGVKNEMSTIKVEQKEGLKCQRCWAIFDKLINDEVCQRCNDVVSGGNS